MERIERTEMYAGIARLIAQRSTCARAQVGVIVVRDKRILVHGYNGAPAGMAHCDHECNCIKVNPETKRFIIRLTNSGHEEDCPSITPCTRAIHGEANAIAWAAREGINLDDGMLVTTMAPCLPCSQLIIAAGITDVMYLEAYRDMSGVELLREADVSVWT